MTRKRKTEADASSSSSVNSEPAPTTEDHKDKSSQPKTKRIRLGAENKQESEQYYEAFKKKEDWSQNIVVIESICNHLPLKDLRSARLVCTVWAIAGAVPLSHKSVVAKNRYHGLLLEEIEEHLNVFQRNPVLKTGFRLRNVRLYWGPMTNLSPAEIDSVLKSWLAIFRSEEFQLVTSLKIYDCPHEAIAKFLLPVCLPKYWRNLKSLVFGHCFRVDTWVVSIADDSEKVSFPELELEELGMVVDNHWKIEYNWDFLKKCSKLKKLDIIVTDCKEFNPDNYNEAMETQRQRLVYDGMLAALQEKKLTSLRLNYRLNPMVMYDDIILQPMTIEIKSFFERLLKMNQQILEQLQISTAACSNVVQQLFANIPYAEQLQRLKSLKVKCSSVNFSVDEAGRLSAFYEALSVFHAKGYLKVENFCLSVNEHDFVNGVHTSINFASEKSARVAIEYIGEIGDLAIHLPQGFEDMMRESFPETNYLCMPKQLRQSNVNYSQEITGTAIFEKLGRDSVFNVPLGYAMWKSLDIPKTLEYEALQQRWGIMRFHDDYTRIHDPVPITSNTLANVKTDWINSELGYNGLLFMFDTVPDLEEAWAKAKVITSNCCWSTVREDDMAPDDQKSAVFCRMFQDTKQLSGSR